MTDCFHLGKGSYPAQDTLSCTEESNGSRYGKMGEPASEGRQLLVSQTVLDSRGETVPVQLFFSCELKRENS